MHLASCIRSLLLALVPLVPTRLACAQSLPPPALPTNEAQWKMEKPFALEGLRPVKVERTLIYQPSTEWAYSHHQSITFFKGRFHAIWSNGRKDEDAPGQRVLTASSADFLHWSTPRPLVDSVTENGAERTLTAAGFHQYQGKLVAYFGNYGPGMKNTRLEAVTTTDGSHWSSPILMGVPVNPNHGPQPTASGRLIISGNISFPYTDDPSGLTGWKMSGIYPESMAATLEDNPRTFWEIAKAQGWGASLCEGSFYQTDDRVLHMLLRSAGKHRHRLWLTESRDDGLSWSHPMETNFSDTDTKFHLGRLPDGRFYQVGSPIGKNRTPLVLSLSKDGVRFSEHYVLGDEHYERRQEGKWKLGEYGYPHTLVHEGHLYVIVSRQKEAVEVMRVALEDLDASKRAASSTSAPQQGTGALPPSSGVALTLAKVFSEHAVLQRRVSVPVWGTAAAGSKIVVRFAAQEKEALADATGRWMVKLDPMEACAKPQDLTVSNGSNAAGESLRLSDILVGDVWLGSGQSNMDWVMSQCERSPEVSRRLKEANNPTLRLLNVGHAIAAEPKSTCAGEWVVATAKQAAAFSAVGYMFGDRLQRTLDVPIGMINVAYGGSQIEQWLPADALTKGSHSAPYLNKWKIALADYPESKAIYDQKMTVFRQQFPSDADWKKENAERKKRGEKPIEAPTEPQLSL